MTKQKKNKADHDERMHPLIHQREIFYFEHLGRYHFVSQFVKNKTVLDVACGNGYGSSLLNQAGSNLVVGVDSSPEAINYAQKNYAEKGLKFIKANALNLPFNKKTFDIVVSLETIEHLDNPDKFLREIKRVLRNNGLLILSTPNRFTSPLGNPYHKKEYCASSLEKLLKRNFNNYCFYCQNNDFSTNILKVNSPSIINNIKFYQLSKHKDLALYFLILASDQKLPLATKPLYLCFPDDISPAVTGKLRKILRIREGELKQIYASRGWKIISLLHKFRLKIPLLNKL